MLISAIVLEKFILILLYFIITGFTFILRRVIPASLQSLVIIFFILLSNHCLLFNLPVKECYICLYILFPILILSYLRNDVIFKSFSHAFINLLFSILDTDSYPFIILFQLCFSLFISYFIILFSGCLEEWLGDTPGIKKHSDLGNRNSLNICYITLVGINGRAEKVLKYFNVVNNCFSIECTYWDFKSLDSKFRKLYFDGFIRVRRISFFNFVSGNVVYDEIVKLGVLSHLDREYFLLHFNQYALCIFLTNQDLNGNYFCEGVILSFSVKFWLDKLNLDGSFKSGFLSYCGAFSNIHVSELNAKPFIHKFNVLQFDGVFLGDRDLIGSDLESIRDLSLLDDRSVDNFICINSNLLCSEYGISNSDWVSLSYNYRCSNSYKKFLVNGGSF